MFEGAKDQLSQELDAIRDAGLYKDERIIVSDQAAKIEVSTGESVLNFCANNYLGLSNNPELIDAAKAASKTVRVSCSPSPSMCSEASARSPTMAPTAPSPPASADAAPSPRRSHGSRASLLSGGRRSHSTRLRPSHALLRLILTSFAGRPWRAALAMSR